jgi:ABC-type amino acid transport substrate-binding protein
VIDFSYAFYRSGLGVAVAERRQAGLSAIWEALTSRAFLSVVGALAGVLFVVGALVWLFERKHNSAQFERDPKQGLFSGFWWAAVTMTTTGYGDKAPTTVGGRILAILWMFTALVVTAWFTAQLAATLTASSIQSPVTSPTDLALVRVGNVADAASTAALQSYGVRPRAYADVSAGLKAVADREIDAFVHDEPILAWEIAQVPGVTLTPVRFAPQDYAIVLPPDTPRREAVNRALLEVLASDQWKAIQRRYLGDPR